MDNPDTATPEIQERRTFERFPARFPVKFKDAREGFGTNVFLRDASAEGARLTTQEHLFLNDSVSLEVQLPDGKGPLTLKGQVMWTKNKEPNIWDVGLRFHKTDLMNMWRVYTIALGLS